MNLRRHAARRNAGFASGANVNATHEEPAADIGGPAIPFHPRGIKPLGNQFLDSGPNARESAGVFRALPEEVLAVFLEYLDPRAARLLGYTCKFLYAFCNSDDVWKALFLVAYSSDKLPFTWRGSWRSTLLNLPRELETKVDCSNVFSDVLHRPFVCSNIALGRYASSIPQTNQTSRLESLTYEEFSDKWSDKPFILTKCIQEWPAYQSWDLDRFLASFSDVEFRAEAVDWPYRTYSQYMFDNHDENPLYLFDREFAEKMQLRIGREKGTAYWKPECFGPDLFEVLEEERPSHRWLIIGPERSGSTFHKDPNGTSAWNAVIQGAKYWIMFPSTVSVPGVYTSKDHSEVTSPWSIAEWLLEFHAEARRVPGCVEGVCNAGEILHVPSGWWHLVVNLENGIALTENFVPVSHLSEVLSFLRDKPEQVTGFKDDVEDPYDLFVSRLGDRHPGLLAKGLEELDRKQARKKRKWDTVVASSVEEGQPQEKGSGFSFGFGDEGEVP